MWIWVTDSRTNTADRTDEAAQASDAGAGRSPSQGEAADAIWRGLADLDEKLHLQRNIRLLTPEARVLIHLKLNGSVPVTTAMQVAGTSYRGFYAVLERLKQAGIVATVKDPQDQRVRRLSLDPSIPISPVNR